MLDGTEYFECACGSSEHTLRFILNKEDKEIYTDIYLNQWRPIYKRIWVGIKYIFGYKSKYGEWDSWILRPEDTKRLIALLNKLHKK